MSVRGPIPDPATVDWQEALHALHRACMRVPIKQNDRSREQQAAVEEFTRRMVQVSELFNGPELGLLDRPVSDECSGDEFICRASTSAPKRLSDE